MQVIKLDLDHENFFCPVTGQLIRNDETYQPSDATAFVFLDEVSDFDFISDELQPLWDEVQELDEDGEFEGDLFEEFAKKVTRKSIVCFEVTTHGIGCGPVSFTARFGIDMNFCADEDERADEDAE